MSGSQAIFVFDTNAFSAAQSPEELQNALTCLRIVCLRLITELSRNTTNFKFSLKFFNSRGSLYERIAKFPLFTANLEAFENLEAEIICRYQQFTSIHRSQAFSDTKILEGFQNGEKTAISPENLPPVKLLGLALTQVLCDFEWDTPDLSSPPKNQKGHVIETIKNNYVFLISSIPTDRIGFLDYFGVKDLLRVEEVKNLLMSPALYKKFVEENHINLVWLDTSNDICANTIDHENLKWKQIVKKAIGALCGTVLPLQFLYQKNLFSCAKKLFETPFAHFISVPNVPEDSMLGDKSSLVVPFSCLFSHCIAERQVQQLDSGETCYLLQFLNGLSLKISLLSTRKKSSSFSSQPVNLKQAFDLTEYDLRQADIEWHRFSIEGIVEKGGREASSSSYICVPQNSISDVQLSSDLLTEVNKILLHTNRSLVLKCETKSGLTAVGTLTPLRGAFSVISISASALLNTDSSPGDVKHSEIDEMSSFLERKWEDICNCIEMTKKGVEGVKSNHKNFFEMSTLERWFVPNFKRNSLVTGSLEKSRFNKEKRAQKKRQTKKNRKSPPRLRKISTKQNSALKTLNVKMSNLKSVIELPESCAEAKAIELPPSETESNSVEQHVQNEKPNLDICDLNSSSLAPTTACEESRNEFTESKAGAEDESELLKRLRNIYQLALEQEQPLISSCQSIVNLTCGSFGTKKSTGIQDDVYSFLSSYILIDDKEISKKYAENSETVTPSQRIRECQLQVILHLELQAAIPTSPNQTCFNKVVDLLRAMNFIVGPLELSQFLKETILPSYGHNLRDLLVEISDELNLHILPDQCSSASSASDLDSPVNTVKSSQLSRNSSVHSVRSSSSQSQLSRKSSSFIRTSIPGIGITNRQIMVPSRLLKKHKTSENIEKQVRRKSPRLILKNKNNNLSPCTNKKMNSARRNLFNVESKVPRKRMKSPRSAEKTNKKRKVLTPRGRHVLKTNCVPETPSPKQGNYVQRMIARQRDKSEANSTVSEVMESPVPCKKNEPFVSNRLNVLKRNGSFYANTYPGENENKGVEMHLASHTLSQETSKVEPSHFFSEILKSPHTERALKRCSKRLFLSNTPPQVKKSIHNCTPPKKKIIVNENLSSPKSQSLLAHELSFQTPRKSIRYSSEIFSYAKNEDFQIISESVNKSPLLFSESSSKDSLDKCAEIKLSPKERINNRNLPESNVILLSGNACEKSDFSPVKHFVDEVPFTPKKKSLTPKVDLKRKSVLPCDDQFNFSCKSFKVRLSRSSVRLHPDNNVPFKKFPSEGVDISPLSQSSSVDNYHFTVRQELKTTKDANVQENCQPDIFAQTVQKSSRKERSSKTTKNLNYSETMNSMHPPRLRSYTKPSVNLIANSLAPECTPQQRRVTRSSHSFTPPTPLGLLHLTTSPVILAVKSKKLC